MTTDTPLTRLYGVIFVNVIFQSFRLLVEPLRPFVPALAPGFIGAPRTVTVKGGPWPSRSDLPLMITSTAAALH